MILQEHKREINWKKIARENYPIAKRIREMEWAYEKAMRANDYHHSRYYDREIDKLYKKAGYVE